MTALGALNRRAPSPGGASGLAPAAGGGALRFSRREPSGPNSRCALGQGASRALAAAMLGGAQAPRRGWGLALRHRGRTRHGDAIALRQRAKAMRPPQAMPPSERQRCGPPRRGPGWRGDQKPRRAAQRGRVAGAAPRLGPPCLSPQGELGGRPAAASSEGSRGPVQGPGRGFAPRPRPAPRGARATRRSPPCPHSIRPGPKRNRSRSRNRRPRPATAQDTSSGSRLTGVPSPAACSAGPPRSRRSMASAR